MRAAYVGGTFDLFHTGHVNLFRQVKQRFEYVIAAVNGDGFAESYKRRPVMHELERLGVVHACQYVDMAFLVESHESQRNHIRAFAPVTIIHGTDWQGDSLARQLNIDDDFMSRHNVSIQYVPYTYGISTSDIMQRMEDYGKTEATGKG